MMAERHYDDETLVAIMEAEADATDAHLRNCPSCSETLRSVRMVAGTLRDRCVWDTQTLSEEPKAATIAKLRAFANRMDDEDARAEVYVRELLAGSSETWSARLEAHPEYRTAGVVRKLIAEASSAIDTMPRNAVVLAHLAVNLSIRLPEATGTVQLRGAARRELAYALYYTGSFAEALEETTRASEEFAGCLVNEYDLARLGIVRALVLRALERWSEALAAAEDSVRAFAEFSDIEREASARIAEAHLLFSMREFEKAVRTLSDREEVLRATSHAETHARVLMNLGYAYWQMGRTSEGMGYYDAATEIFRGLGIRTEALRIQWAVARMLRESGHASMSLEKSRNIASQFEELGMTSEWALVSLDIAEIILDEQKFDEVEAICRAAIGAFERAGVSYTAKALTALAYMREATRNKTITAPLVRQVREYIRRLPIDGELLFIPLP